MPDPKKYNLEYRPSTYFPTYRPKQRELTLVDIEDPLVRAVIDYLREAGEYEGHTDGDESTESPRLSGQDEAVSANEPATFFGGCCLPNLQEEEIEIARVHLESTTFDIISVRAQKQDGRLLYSVVDEYEGQLEYTCKRESSDQPLTMAEVIDLMESTDVDLDYTGLVLGMIQHRYEYSGDAEQWVHFASVSSNIYPELGAWYEDAMEEWYEANRGTTAHKERGEATDGE